MIHDLLHRCLRLAVAAPLLFLITPAAVAASYAGTYSGTFSGGDSGTWTATVSSSGALSMTGYSNNLGGAITGTGQVSTDGLLTMTTGSTSTGATFSGTVNPSTGAISGTFTNTYYGISGTFAGSLNTTVGSFAGTYSGSFTGGDSGTWTATVSSSGALTLAGYSNSSGSAITGSGQVSSEGSLIMTTGSTSTGAVFTGVINASTGAVSGTFTNSYYGISGSFSGSRTSTAVSTTAAPTTTTSTTTAATTTTAAGTTTTTLPPGQQVNMNVAAGWNLIGNGSATPIDVPATFGNSALVTTVWKWIAATGKWAFYAPSLTPQALESYAVTKGYDVLAIIDGGEGFWVNANQAMTVPMPSGTALTSSSFQEGKPGALRQGWNLVSIGNTKTPSGFNSDVGINPPSPGAVAQNISTLWAWDNSASKWYFYAPSLEAQGGTALADYIAAKGYLDFGTAGKSLGPGVGFWVNKL